MPGRPVLALLAAAIVVAFFGAGAALAGRPAAGVVFVALAVAMSCTAVRHHLRSETRR